MHLLRSAGHRPVCPHQQRRVPLTVSSVGQNKNFDTDPPKRKKQPYFKPKPESTRQQAGKSEGETQRLSKVLAAAGVASRRACETLIEQGVVKVNGETVTTQGTVVNPKTDKVSVRGSPIVLKAPALYYFAVNKPKGYVCSNADDKEGKRAVDLLEPFMNEWKATHKGTKELPPRMFTVGRLDVATTGLLFLTNDGQWAQDVIHPSAGLTKEYIVMLERVPNTKQLERMMGGVVIDGTRVQPVSVSVLGGGKQLRVVVSDGKKHEVRLLVAEAGLEIVSLKRVRLGGYRIPRTLRLGEYIQLTPAAAKLMMSSEAQEQAMAQDTDQDRAYAAAAAAAP